MDKKNDKDPNCKKEIPGPALKMSDKDVPSASAKSEEDAEPDSIEEGEESIMGAVMKTQTKMFKLIHNLKNPNKTWSNDPLYSYDWDRAGVPGTFCASRVKRYIYLSSKFILPNCF